MVCPGPPQDVRHVPTRTPPPPMHIHTSAMSQKHYRASLQRLVSCVSCVCRWGKSDECWPKFQKNKKCKWGLLSQLSPTRRPGTGLQPKNLSLRKWHRPGVARHTCWMSSTTRSIMSPGVSNPSASAPTSRLRQIKGLSSSRQAMETAITRGGSGQAAAGRRSSRRGPPLGRGRNQHTGFST